MGYLAVHNAYIICACDTPMTKKTYYVHFSTNWTAQLNTLSRIEFQHSIWKWYPIKERDLEQKVFNHFIVLIMKPTRRL